MASGIPQPVADSILVKAGRRCCVCRRFRPTKLQVHHILEQAKGGTDEEDNLMPICLMCHSDVHSHVPFARRFTIQELKGHRDSLFCAVQEGRLPGDEEDNTTEVNQRVVVRFVTDQVVEDELSPAAIELLLTSVNAKGNWDGRIGIVDRRGGKQIFIENQSFGMSDRREQSRYLAGLEELQFKGYVSYEGEAMRSVTHSGYLKADELVTLHAPPAT